jgi:hypothetical protein
MSPKLLTKKKTSRTQLLGSQSCTSVESISRVPQSNPSGKKKKAQAGVQKKKSSSGSAKRKNFEDTTFGESKLYISRVHKSSPSVKSITQLQQGKKKKLKRECRKKKAQAGVQKKKSSSGSAKRKNFEDTTFGESKLYISRVHKSSPSVKSISQIHQGKKKKLKRECRKKKAQAGVQKKKSSSGSARKRLKEGRV